MLEAEVGRYNVKMEGGATSQGMQAATRSWKRQRNNALSPQTLQKEPVLLTRGLQRSVTDFRLLSLEENIFMLF